MDIVIQLSQRMHLICYQLRVDLTQMNIHIRTPPDRQPDKSGMVEQGLGTVQTTLSHFRSVGSTVIITLIVTHMPKLIDCLSLPYLSLS